MHRMGAQVFSIEYVEKGQQLAIDPQYEATANRKTIEDLLELNPYDYQV